MSPRLLLPRGALSVDEGRAPAPHLCGGLHSAVRLPLATTCLMHRALSSADELVSGTQVLAVDLSVMCSICKQIQLSARERGSRYLHASLQALSASGAIINVLRIPEKWFRSPHPRKAGPFDYWLNSHQIMHILVIWAIWHYHRGACLDYAHHFGPIPAPA